ncbi:uncharacterized protein LOC135498804 [Lineus longissimus]|uniref:uncharacterized protein LOC135498804 n=1 Tax=Lineus longissimus TaxID=88925 RepID=UPI00315CC062
MRRKVSFRDSETIHEDEIEGSESDKTSEKSTSEIDNNTFEKVQSVMQEEKLTLDQKMALKMIRGSFKMADGADVLSDEQLQRTLNIYRLATQISLETILIGVNPSSIFSSLARFGSRYIKGQEPEASASMLIWPEGKLQPIEGITEDIELQDPFDAEETTILPMTRLNMMSPSFPNIIRPDIAVRCVTRMGGI